VRTDKQIRFGDAAVPALGSYYAGTPGSA
jgi:hypothetical protein